MHDVMQFALAGGAAFVVSVVFDELRRMFPVGRLPRVFNACLYDPRLARCITLVVPWLLIVALAMVNARTTNTDVWTELQTLLLAAIAIWLPQMRHAQQKYEQSKDVGA